MAKRVVWSQGKMYISSNLILPKALRTVLSMVRELGGAGLSQAGVIPARVKRAAATRPQAGGVPAHRAAGLPRSQ